jgi:hypothetical protein
MPLYFVAKIETKRDEKDNFRIFPYDHGPDIEMFIPPPQNVGGGGLQWIRFVASVGPSVSIFVSTPYILYQLKDFLQTWLKCSPQQGDVQNPYWPCVSSRSRSQLKVKYQTQSNIRQYVVSAL